MMAAMGRQLKQSVKVFHSLMLYRRLPGCERRGCRQYKTLVSCGAEKRGSLWGWGRWVLTFVIKAVNPVDTSTLVVSTQYEKVFGIFNLVGKEEADGF